MAPHSSTLAWKITWTEEPGRLQSMGVAERQTWLSDFTFNFHFHVLEKEMAAHSSVLAWRMPGTGEPGGLPSLGSHRVRHDWSDLAAAAWWEGLLPAHWWLEQGLLPLVGMAMSKGVFSGRLWAQEDFRQPVCWQVELCSSLVGCLTWGIPALKPTGCWVGPGLVLTTQLDVCFSKYSHRWTLPDIPATSDHIPSGES